MRENYVFMLVHEFFDLSEFFFISGRVTMSTLRIRVCLFVCRQIKRTSSQKAINLFLTFFQLFFFITVPLFQVMNTQRNVTATTIMCALTANTGQR